MAEPEWQIQGDGLVRGNIGVFPTIGAWVVWDNFSGEWLEAEPFTFAEVSGRMPDPSRKTMYLQFTRTREETIEEAKRLAIEWLSARNAE